MRSRPLHPVSASDESAKGIIAVGVRVVRCFSEHRMGTYAAALAYRGLFALFPFMLLLVVLVGVFGPPNAFDWIVEEVKARSSDQVPQQLEPVVEQGKEQIQPLEEVVERAEKQAGGEFLLFAIALALWSISALASTLADAFNTAYGVSEARRGGSGWRLHWPPVPSSRSPLSSPRGLCSRGRRWPSASQRYSA